MQVNIILFTLMCVYTLFITWQVIKLIGCGRLYVKAVHQAQLKDSDPRKNPTSVNEAMETAKRRHAELLHLLFSKEEIRELDNKLKRNNTK